MFLEVDCTGLLSQFICCKYLDKMKLSSSLLLTFATKINYAVASDVRFDILHFVAVSGNLILSFCIRLNSIRRFHTLFQAVK